MRTVAAALCLGWVLLFVPQVGRTHPAVPTSAEVTIEADGRFQAVLHFDTLAFVLNDTSARIGNEPMEALLDAPREELTAQLAEAKGRMLHGFRVTTDRGTSDAERCEFPTTDEILNWKATIHPTLPVEVPARLSGRLPTSAGTVAFRFPSVLEQVILTVDRPDEEPFAELIEAGGLSSALPVKVRAAATDSLAKEAGKLRGEPASIPPSGWGLALCVLGLCLLGGWSSTRRRPRN